MDSRKSYSMKTMRRWCVLLGVGDRNLECILYNAQLGTYKQDISSVGRSLGRYIKNFELLRSSMRDSCDYLVLFGVVILHPAG